MRTHALAKTRQSPVEITHLRLAYELAPKGGLEAKFIKDINKALGPQKPDGPTRLTVFKMRGSPIAMLLNEKAIGSDELRAVQDIEIAFRALSGATGFKPLSLERVQGGQRDEWSDRTMRAVERYKKYAEHWSQMKKLGDKTLEVVFAAVIDEMPFTDMKAHIGIGHSKVKQVIIRGLRDYAARAGWVSGKQAELWKAEASTSFRRSRA